MVAIRKQVRIGTGGTIQVQDAALPEGAEAEVIVLVGEVAPADATDALPPLVSMLSAGRGLFTSPEEIDRYIRDLRDEWD